jgi:hypothetical protein
LGKIHSFDVCGIVQDIDNYTVEAIAEHKQIRENYNIAEANKEQLVAENRALFEQLLS